MVLVAVACDGMARLGALAVLVALLSHPLHADADFVFRVPEVMVRHAAAPKPVGTGRVNATSNNDTRWSSQRVEVHYEEYYVEHEVTTTDARRAARVLRLKTGPVPGTRAGCGTCSRRELEYCEARVVADHCCCERAFLPESFPWLPHTCYIGPHRCRPLAGDCAIYARLRDCCCYDKLAERWKGILSASGRLGFSGVTMLLVSMLLFMTYL